MGIFNFNLKKRLQSLEEHIGAVYVRKDGYGEHQADSQSWSSSIERRLKDVEEFVKESKQKKGKK